MGLIKYCQTGKPRRTRGTPAYYYRNYFALGAIGIGCAIFAVTLLPLAPDFCKIRKLLENTEEQKDRDFLFLFGSTANSEGIEKDRKLMDDLVKYRKPRTNPIAKFFRTHDTSAPAKKKSQTEPFVKKMKYQETEVLKFENESEDFIQNDPISAKLTNRQQKKQTIKKFFDKSMSENDFEVPSKKIKIWSKPESSKSAKRKTSSKKQPKIKYALVRNEEIYDKLISNTASSGDIYNKELQLALALSKSEMQKETSTFQEDPIAAKMLMEYEYKKSKQVQDYDLSLYIPSKKKAKWRNKFTPLTMRKEEVENKKIRKKIDKILESMYSSEISSPATLSTVGYKLKSKYLLRLQTRGIIWFQDISNLNFYVDGICEQSNNHIGCLLRDFNNIPGRDLSPIRQKQIVNKQQNESFINIEAPKNADDKNIEVLIRETSPDIFSECDLENSICPKTPLVKESCDIEVQCLENKMPENETIKPQLKHEETKINSFRQSTEKEDFAKNNENIIDLTDDNSDSLKKSTVKDSELSSEESLTQDSTSSCIILSDDEVNYSIRMLYTDGEKMSIDKAASSEQDCKTKIGSHSKDNFQYSSIGDRNFLTKFSKKETDRKFQHLYNEQNDISTSNNSISLEEINTKFKGSFLDVHENSTSYLHNLRKIHSETFISHKSIQGERCFEKFTNNYCKDTKALLNHSQTYCNSEIDFFSNKNISREFSKEKTNNEYSPLFYDEENTNSDLNKLSSNDLTDFGDFKETEAGNFSLKLLNNNPNTITNIQKTHSDSFILLDTPQKDKSFTRYSSDYNKNLRNKSQSQVCDNYRSNFVKENCTENDKSFSSKLPFGRTENEHFSVFDDENNKAFNINKQFSNDSIDLEEINDEFSIQTFQTHKSSTGKSKVLKKVQSDSFLLPKSPQLKKCFKSFSNNSNNNLNKEPLSGSFDEIDELVYQGSTNLNRPKGFENLLSGNICCNVEPYEEINQGDKIYLVRTKNISAKPDFNNMDSPTRLSQLYKYGLKPLKKRQAIIMLEFIYNQTHPFIVDTTENNLQKETAEYSQKITSNDSIIVYNNNGIKNKYDLKDCSGSFLIEDKVLLLKEEKDYIFQTNRKKGATVLLPLHIAWFNLIKSNKNLYEAILHYEPIDLDEIYAFFKSIGLRYNPKDLKAFLDNRGIIFRYDLGKNSERDHSPDKNSVGSQNN